jgi:hypothetical protein
MKKRTKQLGKPEFHEGVLDMAKINVLLKIMTIFYH